MSVVERWGRMQPKGTFCPQQRVFRLGSQTRRKFLFRGQYHSSGRVVAPSAWALKDYSQLIQLPHDQYPV